MSTRRSTHPAATFSIRLACIAYCSLLTLLLLVPDPNRLTGIDELPGPLSEHGIHFLAFTVLGVLVYASHWPLRTAVFVGLLATYAIGVELLQAFTKRDVAAMDVLENVLGIAAGIGVCWLIRKRTARRLESTP